MYEVPNKNKKEGNINDWAKAVEKIDPEFSKRLDRNRETGFDNLEKLNLPRYKKIKADLSNFLEKPEEFVKKLESEKYFFSLIPKEKEMPRVGKAGLDLNQLVSFVEERIKKEDRDRYEIIVNEYFENAYSGIIIIGNESDQVLIEAKKGILTPLIRGEIAPEYIIKRDRFTGSFEYSFQDEDLRRIFYKALTAIPHEGYGRDLKFHPGYYEFVIARKDGESEEEPIFIEAREDEIYELNWKSEI